MTGLRETQSCHPDLNTDALIRRLFSFRKSPVQTGGGDAPLTWGLSLPKARNSLHYTEMTIQLFADFKELIVIEIPITTKRLIIRPFESKDLEQFLRFMLDDDSTRFLTFDEEQKTRPGATALFKYVIQAYASPEPIHSYAIAELETGEYVGSCGYAPYEEGIVECYYCVNAEHRGMGIATEAAQALIQALASSTDFREIRAYCHPDNTAAHDVALKSGMTARGMAMHKDFGRENQLFVRVAS